MSAGKILIKRGSTCEGTTRGKLKKYDRIYNTSSIFFQFHKVTIEYIQH